MEPFPKLQENEFAALFVDKNTGIVLDSEQKYARDNTKSYFTFNSFEEAKKFCEIRIKENTNLEYHIYDYSETHVKTGPN